MTSEEIAGRMGDKFQFTAEGCWIWTGAFGGSKGNYGVLVLARSNRYAHRVMYELLVGKILRGLTLDHLCRRPRCVNPDHLEAVTHRENVLRGESPPANQARRTHCIRGHALEGDNLRIYRGARRCRACARFHDLHRTDRGHKS